LLNDLAAPSVVRQEVFAGRWFFCDDGWTGALWLRIDENRQLEGSFRSERFGADYRVTGAVGSAPHAVELLFHDFNWLDTQRFVGHIMISGRPAMSGCSDWRGTPFGFFATRSTRELLGQYRAGVPVIADMAGRWTASLDGRRAAVDLHIDNGAAVATGTCVPTGGGPGYDIVARQDAMVPHRMQIHLTPHHANDPPAAATCYLMSRSKNAVAGSVTVDCVERGFYMVRFS
jgi:hypothetical protein